MLEEIQNIGLILHYIESFTSFSIKFIKICQVNTLLDLLYETNKAYQDEKIIV